MASHLQFFIIASVINCHKGAEACSTTSLLLAEGAATSSLRSISVATSNVSQPQYCTAA